MKVYVYKLTITDPFISFCLTNITNGQMLYRM